MTSHAETPAARTVVEGTGCPVIARTAAPGAAALSQLGLELGEDGLGPEPVDVPDVGRRRLEVPEAPGDVPRDTAPQGG